MEVFLFISPYPLRRQSEKECLVSFLDFDLGENLFLQSVAGTGEIALLNLLKFGELAQWGVQSNVIGELPVTVCIC